MRRRLQKLERRTQPTRGELPCILMLPSDPDEQQRVVAEIAEREARGQTVIVLHKDDDPLAALVDAIGC